MARGSRKITLGGNTAPEAPITETSTPATDNPATVGDVSAVLAPETAITEQDNTMTDTAVIVLSPDNTATSPLPPDAPAPDVADEVDEDLQQPASNVNQKSSLKDKRDYYMREARKAGRDYLGGQASQITLAEKALEGAVNDALTYAKYPNGTVQDDALELYKAFRMPRKTDPVVDTTTGSFNSNVGKYRNMIFLGMAHRADSQAWFGKVVDIYRAKSAMPDVRKSLKPFNGDFEAAMDIVREQLERDTKAGGVAPLLSDGAPDDNGIETEPNEIFDAMLKKDKTYTDDAVTQLIEAFKSLMLAKDGKQSKSGKGNFIGIINPRLDALIEELQDFAKTELDAAGSTKFSVGTHKQKRTRRVIKAPVVAGNADDPDANPDLANGSEDVSVGGDTPSNEEEEAQDQGNNE